MLVTTFMDYLRPTLVDAVDMRMEHTRYPSQFTEIGSKDVDEGAEAERRLLADELA